MKLKTLFEKNGKPMVNLTELKEFTMVFDDNEYYCIVTDKKGNKEKFKINKKIISSETFSISDDFFRLMMTFG